MVGNSTRKLIHGSCTACKRSSTLHTPQHGRHVGQRKDVTDIQNSAPDVIYNKVPVQDLSIKKQRLLAFF
jgi:hypothetical protein